MPRFIVSPEEIQKGSVLLSPEESRHALSVLRLRVGAAVDLMDGQGRAVRGIVGAVKEGRVQVIPNQNLASAPFLKVKTTLAVSVIKPERMEWLIEKSSELGVSCIAPILTERSVVQLSRERWQSKILRWRKIAAESCKQCGQALIPLIEEPVPFKKILERLADFDRVLIPTLAVHPEESFASSLGLKSKTTLNILGLIGPEGDFTKKEVLAATAAGAKPVSLGALTLRSETAALYFLSAVNFFMETSANEKIS